MKDTIQYDKEVADFKAAIDMNPNDAMAYHNLGVTYTMDGQLELAREYS